MNLTNQQIKHLKALAHSRKPIVRIGQNGLSDAVLKELDGALQHHELLKIKIAGDRDTRVSIVEAVCERLDTQCISLTGGVAVLFRPGTEADKSSNRINLGDIR